MRAPRRGRGARSRARRSPYRSEEHTSELQSRSDLVCRLLLEKKKESDVVPICSMVDTFELLAHADEGRIPQTRFVAGKALSTGLYPSLLVTASDLQTAGRLLG